MNKIIKFLYALTFVCSSIFIVSCSSDELTSYQQAPAFDNLKFIVHVNNTSAVTRAASDKKDWSVGDKIFMSIDDNDNNLCSLEYKGNGEWTVSKVNEQTSFANDQGKLNAVHADKLEWSGSQVSTSGDILYTKEGTYTKQGNVVVINLNMSERPIARIAIVGMDRTCWIDELQEFTKLTSLSAMNWTTTTDAYEKQYKETYGDTCVFYGNLTTNEKGETDVSISNNEGISYHRTYSKSLNAGDYIIIQGPLSKESASWSKNILVHSIMLDKTELNLTAGDKVSIKPHLYHDDADNKALTWSSSNNYIATVDQEGNITALSNGDAQIVVKADDGSAEASCNIHVRDLEDFISVGYELRSSMVGNGTTQDFTLPVTNNYSKPIHLSKLIGFTSNSVDVLSHFAEFTSSISNVDLHSNETANIYVHLYFSKNFSWSWGSTTGNQNWITIEFTRDGDNTVYKIKKYLPWDLY